MGSQPSKSWCMANQANCWAEKDGLSSGLRRTPSWEGERRRKWRKMGSIEPSRNTGQKGGEGIKRRWGTGTRRHHILYFAHCILHFAFCTLYFAYYISHLAIHFAFRTLALHFALRIFRISHIAFRTLHFALCILHFPLCTLHHIGSLPCLLVCIAPLVLSFSHPPTPCISCIAWGCSRRFPLFKPSWAAQAPP